MVHNRAEYHKNYLEPERVIGTKDQDKTLRYSSYLQVIRNKKDRYYITAIDNIYNR